MYVPYHIYMPGGHRIQKRVLDSLEMELWMLINQHVGPGV